MEAVNHEQRAHALLSASGASRWLNCTVSPRLEEGFPNESTSFAQEGTLAHEFAELNLKLQLDEIGEDYYHHAATPLKASEYYSEEMEEYVQKHIDYVLEQHQEAKQKCDFATLLIEQKIDLTHLIEDGFGTCDVVLIADGVMEVIDLKYGLGVRVDAENNSQLMLYGLGALEAFGFMYDIHTVKLTITQPRMDSISSWSISAEDLRKWGEEVVKPKALLAYEGEGEQTPGDWCKFCKAAPRCKAQEDKANELAALDFQDPTLLTDSELIDIYKKIPNISAWFNKVTEYLYNEALKGKSWPEHKLVDGQNRRGWVDETKAGLILKENGFDLNKAFTTKLKGIGDIEKLVTKAKFPTLFSEVVANKKTSPSLVHESDKRPAMGVDSAKADFADDI